MNQLFNNVIVKNHIESYDLITFYLNLEKVGPIFKPAVFAFINIAHRYRDKETHHNGVGGLH